MINLEQILDAIYLVSDEAKELIILAATEVSYPKGFILINDKRISNNIVLYFL